MEGRFPRADARGIFYDLGPPTSCFLLAAPLTPAPTRKISLSMKMTRCIDQYIHLDRSTYPNLCVANKMVTKEKIGQVAWALQNFRSKKYTTFPDKRTHLFSL